MHGSPIMQTRATGTETSYGLVKKMLEDGLNAALMYYGCLKFARKSQVSSRTYRLLAKYKVQSLTVWALFLPCSFH